VRECRIKDVITSVETIIATRHDIGSIVVILMAIIAES
jgi:hypothetical protein